VSDSVRAGARRRPGPTHACGRGRRRPAPLRARSRPGRRPPARYSPPSGSRWAAWTVHSRPPRSRRRSSRRSCRNSSRLRGLRACSSSTKSSVCDTIRTDVRTTCGERA
jgi:hypothetical protein